MPAVAAKPKTHCPFGCESPDFINEQGYCRHLVGFTNDGKTLEPVQPTQRRTNNEPTGDFQVNGGKSSRPVEKGDVLVNPTRTAVIEGVEVEIKAWVSSRVYREDYDSLKQPLPKPKKKLPEPAGV